MIGWDDHSGDPKHRLCGKIDEVRIYGYALSEAEIKALYEANEPPRKKE